MKLLTLLFCKRIESVVTELVKMNKSPIIDPATHERPDQEVHSPAFRQPRNDEHPGPSMKRWVDRFRQLEWGDRLNMVFAAFLGAVLIAALSPILLVLWMCQLARKGVESRLPEDSKAKLQ